MSTQENVQIVKDFFAAIGSGDKQLLLALVAEDIEWIIPGEDWPLAGTHRGHAGLADVLQKASEEVEMTYPKPPEFVAQGDRVLVVGVATGKIKATNKTFEDQTDEHPGVYRHASTGARLRKGCVNGVESYPSTAAYWLSEIRQVTKSRPGFSDLQTTRI